MNGLMLAHSLNRYTEVGRQLKFCSRWCGISRGIAETIPIVAGLFVSVSTNCKRISAPNTSGILNRKHSHKHTLAESIHLFIHTSAFSLGWWLRLKGGFRNITLPFFPGIWVWFCNWGASQQYAYSKKKLH